MLMERKAETRTVLVHSACIPDGYSYYDLRYREMTAEEETVHKQRNA